MRIASMVPSWTETLIEAGANVVARTRFCVHPESTSLIPAVGGTKDTDWAKLSSSRAELVILDKEENPLAMAEGLSLPYWASHITCVFDVPLALRELALIFQRSGDMTVARRLQGFARRWDDVLQNFSSSSRAPVISCGMQVPALIEWFRKPSITATFEKTVYLIWKKPDMAASRDTFIGSMLGLVGVELEVFDVKYPQIDLAAYDPVTTLLLYSSEPYPFAKAKVEIQRLPYTSALVDGESLSWFGIRSLRFLEGLALPSPRR